MGPVESLRSAISNAFTFQGRASRSEFWWLFLLQYLTVTGLVFIDIRWDPLPYFGYFPGTATVFAALSFPAFLSAAIRRLHDTGRTGAWYLVLLIPIAGTPVFLWFMAARPNPGSNRFGPPPPNGNGFSNPVREDWLDRLEKQTSDRPGPQSIAQKSAQWPTPKTRSENKPKRPARRFKTPRVLTVFQSAIESFLFQPLTFGRRATRCEYWCVIPVLWLVILLFIPGDARALWNSLLNREVPSLNPFSYNAATVFLATLVPRMALTVRRLNDSGRNALLALLPAAAGVFGLFSLPGLAVLLISKLPLETLDTGFVAGAVITSFMGGFWDALFIYAAAIEAITWEHLIEIKAATEATVSEQNPSLSQAFWQGYQHDRQTGSQLLIMLYLPLVLAAGCTLAHLFLMVLPSDNADNLHGPAAGGGARHAGKGSANPYAGYAYLAPRTAESELRLSMQRKQEVRALYRTRVLGE